MAVGASAIRGMMMDVQELLQLLARLHPLASPLALPPLRLLRDD
jgi:hypothetical protein